MFVFLSMMSVRSFFTVDKQLAEDLHQLDVEFFGGEAASAEELIPGEMSWSGDDDDDSNGDGDGHFLDDDLDAGQAVDQFCGEEGHASHGPSASAGEAQDRSAVKNAAVARSVWKRSIHLTWSKLS